MLKQIWKKMVHLMRDLM